MNAIALIPLLLAAAPPSVPLAPPQPYSETLAWDPVPGATEYRVYWGGSSRIYTNYVRSTTTTATIPGLTADKYYFTATALNASGESDFSDEVSTAPTPPPLTNWSATIVGTLSLTNEREPQMFYTICKSPSLKGPWKPEPRAIVTITRTNF